MIKVKNHQIPPTILVDRALGISSDPEINKSLAKHWHQKVLGHLSHAEKCLNVIAIDNKIHNQVTFKQRQLYKQMTFNNNNNKKVWLVFN